MVPNKKEGSGGQIPVRVAIIGGGIGGASTAHYLRSLFGASLRLRVFEPGHVGGRIRNVALRESGQRYESGASIIHQRNRYVCQFIQNLGLQQQSEEGGDSVMMVYDGQKMVFQGSSNSFLNSVKLFWRYGFDTFRIQSVVKSMMDKFDRIYKLQDAGVCFTSPTAMLASMDPSFVKMTTLTIADYLTDRGLHRPILDEMVHAVMRNNYNQNNNVHAFVGSVSLSGVRGNLISVTGGNEQVPQKLLDGLQSNLVKPGNELTEPVLCQAQVASIERTGTDTAPRFLVHFTDSKRPAEEFDYVALAAPVHQECQMKLVNMPSVESLRREYQPVASIFVKGLLRTDRLGLPSVKENPKYSIFIASPPSPDLACPFNSLAVNHSIQEKKDKPKKSDFVWKFFANPQLASTSTLTSTYFEKPHDVTTVTWLAYPRYSALSDPGRQMCSFSPVRGFVYLNAIEQVASAMEMSAVSGRNAALLIHAWTHGLKDRIDPIK